VDTFLIFLGVVFGFALCWFTKDNIIVMVTGARSFAAKLEAKAKAIKADL
jgi:hypothetical protein